MQFKGTLILLIVFVALGGYVYFAEYRGQEERQEQEEAAKKALPIEAADISEITLTYPDRTLAAVKRGEKQWEMTSPAGIEADPDEWDTVASNIARIERDQTIATESPELSQYGLDMPSVTVTAKLSDGRTVGVAFGVENPRKTFNYAKLADGAEVFLSPVSWSRLFQKNVNDLRNKKLLAFETDNIDAVRVTGSGQDLELAKSGTEWTIRRPIAAPADESEISMFVSSVGLAKALDFAEESLDPKTAGLEPPSMTLTFHDASAGADRVLMIGKEAGDGRFFARDQSRPTIFIVDQEIPEKSKRPVFDWRDKSITQLNREAIDEIQIVRGSETISLKKSGSDWNLADGRKLQWDKISSMLNTLEFERALQIIDTPRAMSVYGLDRPRLEVLFRQMGNEALGLKYGSSAQDPAGVHLAVSGKPAVLPTILIVPVDVYDKFNIQADDLVETQTN